MNSSNSANMLNPSSTTLAPNIKAIESLAHDGSLSLPDEPLFIIEPKKSLLGFDWRELVVYRELIYFLMWRDVKVRYKQTALGVTWVILQPLVMMLIFTLFFGRLAGLPSDGVPYALFAYGGLLPWTFFAAAAALSGNSIVSSANLITKVYFPRLIIPIAAIGAVLLDLVISFGVLAVLMIYWGVGPTPKLLMLVPLVLMLTMLAFGFGTLMSAVNVKYRDVRIALPFLLQIWFFLSPIIYPSSLVPQRWRWLLALNPMTGIVEGFRTALYGRKPFDWMSLGSSIAITFALCVCAVFVFKRMEKGFADIV
jgi:lipopolysaccharide transport system permease protein